MTFKQKFYNTINVLDWFTFIIPTVFVILFATVKLNWKCRNYKGQIKNKNQEIFFLILVGRMLISMNNVSDYFYLAYTEKPLDTTTKVDKSYCKVSGHFSLFMYDWVNIMTILQLRETNKQLKDPMHKGLSSKVILASSLSFSTLHCICIGSFWSYGIKGQVSCQIISNHQMIWEELLNNWLIIFVPYMVFLGIKLRARQHNM